MKTITRFNNFARTTLIGGLVAILPLGLIFLIFRWIINLIEKHLAPLVNLFKTETRLSTILVYVISVAAIIFLFFLIGLAIQTRIGNSIRHKIERIILMKLPGYKTASDIVRQLFGGSRSFFSEVVLVDVYNSGALMTGFITDKHVKDDLVTVFVPTGPNPTSGNIFHLPKERVFVSTVPVDVAVKSIISCGSGSTEVFENTTFTK